MYFCLQYLSLSDAVVSKVLAPNLTVFSVAAFLRETLSSKEIFAGREHLMNEIASIGIYAVSVGEKNDALLI
jgi:hypothetical protein